MRGFLNQFKGHDHGPLVQFIKYGIAGGIATGVQIVVFYIMAGFVFPALSPDDKAVTLLNFPATDVGVRVRSNLMVPNNTIAFCFSNTVAYLINIKWVFVPGRHKRSVELLMFFAVSGCGVRYSLWNGPWDGDDDVSRIRREYCGIGHDQLPDAKICYF